VRVEASARVMVGVSRLGVVSVVEAGRVRVPEKVMSCVAIQRRRLPRVTFLSAAVVDTSTVSHNKSAVSGDVSSVKSVIFTA